MLRRLAWTSLVAVSVAAPSTAAALPVRDADRFSITIRDDAHACLLTADAPPDPASCAGFNATQRLPAETDDLRTLGMGAVRIGGSPASISVVVEKGPHEPTNQASAQAFAKGILESYVQQVPGATARPPTVKMLRVNGLSVGQITCDLDGVPPSHSILEHLVSYVVASSDGLYSLAVTSSAANAAAADAFGAETIATLAIAHPSTGKGSAYRMGYALGRLVGVLFVAAAVIVTLLVVSRRRTKTAA